MCLIIIKLYRYYNKYIKIIYEIAYMENANMLQLLEVNPNIEYSPLRLTSDAHQTEHKEDYRPAGHNEETVIDLLVGNAPAFLDDISSRY